MDWKSRIDAIVRETQGNLAQVKVRRSCEQTRHAVSHQISFSFNLVSGVCRLVRADPTKPQVVHLQPLAPAGQQNQGSTMHQQKDCSVWAVVIILSTLLPCTKTPIQLRFCHSSQFPADRRCTHRKLCRHLFQYCSSSSNNTKRFRSEVI
jgi:hypothetical protein